MIHFDILHQKCTMWLFREKLSSAAHFTVQIEGSVFRTASKGKFTRQLYLVYGALCALTWFWDLSQFVSAQLLQPVFDLSHSFPGRTEGEVWVQRHSGYEAVISRSAEIIEILFKKKEISVHKI